MTLTIIEGNRGVLNLLLDGFRYRKTRKSNEGVKDWFRMCLGLPFLPVEHIRRAFTLIVSHH